METRVGEIHSGWASGFVRAFVSFLFFGVLHPLPFVSPSDALCARPSPCWNAAYVVSSLQDGTGCV